MFRDCINVVSSEVNIHAMRLGPGKHLKGRKLMGGVITPEEYDYFHEVGRTPSSLSSIFAHFSP
jgi:hypothetical protein